MRDPVRANIDGSDLVAWGDAAPEAGVAIAFDATGSECPLPSIEQIRRLVDLGMAVGFFDPAEPSASFALGALDGLYILCDTEGDRSNFASFEAAMRHGFTLIESQPYGR